ncbi:MAG: 4-(cytidine 5'-diphospho)-2-C-methyl-D-erythritol kinase [Ancalomicrobiaceae bacterium]|nr:4-(cytidine 5'-diphospho)-2-C-methyl-D-erythritol kinase [Ancalomicrobiaceae bacterium]
MPRIVTSAKVNLALAVVGQRTDGYHLIDSLVAFAHVGDELAIEPAEALSLTVTGAFAGDLGAADDNLVLKSARLLQQEAERLGLGRPGAAIHLDKRLPVASGVGGGSGDAATALNGLNALWGFALPHARLAELALTLGADVPMCLKGRPARVSGIGEIIETSPPLPELTLLLVNPRVPVSTAAVFAALDRRDNPCLPDLPVAWDGLDHLVDWLAATRNDLQPPALTLAPAIADVLSALRAQSGCRLARMSGSGATCFGIFATWAAAEAAAKAIATVRPLWWVAAGGTARVL